MSIKIVVPGEMPGFNEIVKAAKQGRGKYQPYNDMKKEYTDTVTWLSKKIPSKDKIFLDITWIEKDKRRDPDNIASAVKFIWDGLVGAGVIKNDGWNENGGWTNHFEVDKDNPRIEIIIKEV